MSSRSVSTAIRYAVFAPGICLSIVAGTGTVAGFFGRHGWMLELATHFRVQYFWLLAIATVVLLAARSRVWTLVSATLAAVNLALIAPLYFGPGPPADTGPTLRAMSQNVFYINRQIERVFELIEDEQPDVMLLLEVTPQWAAALEFYHDAYPYRRVVPRSDANGIGFYSRIKAADVEFRYVGGRPVIVAHLVPPSGPLTVIGVHPSSPREPQALVDRNRELRALAELARREPGPLVVLGDLNITSWSPYFGELLTISGLLDSRRGFGVCGTWPDLPIAARIPIDHCLVSRDVGVLSRRVGPDVGSDHRAILIDLALPQ